ncbi:MAG: class A beta-lactamase-related serine hydrolase [Chitinophagaceae bacterium]|nr:MAG: class A beta-lactamase-related serine hydrolase [Chitinophagaceae bacterium]
MRIFILFLFMAAVLQSPAQSLPDSVVRKLETGISGFRDRYHTPGIAVAIIHGNDVIFSRALGFADQEKKIPATVDYRFPVLSVSKVFTATMAMQLRERGKLSLEDDVSRYLPEFTNGSSRKGKSGISILQLATHTAGFARNTHEDLLFAKQIDDWLLKRRSFAYLTPATKEELLKSLPGIRTEYAPYKLVSYGDRLYSNLGYAMLGISAERAAGMEYASFIRKNIFEPLGMNSSGFDNERPLPALAKGYFWDDSLRVFLPTPAFQSNGALYAGGMYASANDFARFISFQFDTTAAAAKILSSASRSMMASFRIGWKPEYPYVLHEGAMLGYRCVVVYNPEVKIGWVILTNTSEFEFGRINRYFSELLLPVYSLPAPGLQDFAGTYRLEGGADSIRISFRDGKLYSDYPYGQDYPLTRDGNYNFKGASRGAYSVGYEFRLDIHGRLSYLNLGQLKWIRSPG